MRHATDYLIFETPNRRDYVNITPDVEDFVRRSGIRKGLVLVNPMHITAAVESVSLEAPKPSISLSPSAIDARRSARCEMDLSPGTAMSPLTAAAGSIFTLVPLQVMVPRFCVASTKPEFALDRSQG